MQRLYRVEDHTGKGPYNGHAGAVVDNRPTDHHPMFYDKLEAGAACCPPRYAFQSCDHLYVWFDLRECRALRQHGFKIVVYEVPDDAWIGDAFQAKFHYCDASRVEEMEIAA